MPPSQTAAGVCGQQRAWLPPDRALGHRYSWLSVRDWTRSAWRTSRRHETPVRVPSYARGRAGWESGRNTTRAGVRQLTPAIHEDDANLIAKTADPCIRSS
eukprot:scaffold139009_cov29-Tisochrysis_lutea.AAC.5